MVRKVLLLFMIFLLCSAAQAVETWAITYDNVSNPDSLVNLLRTRFSNMDGISVVFDPQTSAPSIVSEGKVYYNDTSHALYVSTDGTTWTQLAAASGVSLDGAYDLGSKIDVDGTVLELEVDDGSNNCALLIDHDEATNDNDAMQITNAADAATAVSIQIDGTAGYDIQGTGDTWNIGITGAASLVGITNTAADCLFDDTYDVSWDTSRDQLLFEDNAVLGIGGAHDAAGDVTFKWNGSNLLIESAAEDTGEVRYGSTNAIDVAHYGNTNTSVAKFNASTATLEFNGYDIQILDDDKLAFGDSDEFVIEYDEDGDNDLVVVGSSANKAVVIGDGTTGTDFQCISSGGSSSTYLAWFDASVNTNQGALKLGNDDYGIDAYFYGETASQLVTWDASVDTWYFGADAEGIDVVFYGDTASQKAWWDESGDEWFFGADAEGVDVTFYGDTASSYAKWDENSGTNGAMLFEAADIALGDGDQILFGDALGTGALALSSTSAVLSLTQVVADTGSVIFGATGTDVPFKWWGETTGDFMEFTGDEMHFDDTDLTMNEGATFQFEANDDAADWTISNAVAETLVFLPTETTDDQTLNFGDATNTTDVRMFGATASTVVYDASGDKVIYDAYDIRLNDDDVLNFGDADETSLQYDEDGENALQVIGAMYGAKLVVENVITTNALAATESGKVLLHQSGQSGGTAADIVQTLPTAVAGLIFHFVDCNETAGSDVTITANTGDKIDDGSAAASIVHDTDADNFASVTLLAVDATNWVTFTSTGTWAAE